MLIEVARYVPVDKVGYAGYKENQQSKTVTPLVYKI
jgi:hypothetical protein